MASPTLTDLQNQVFTLLHEAQNSPVAELDASPGGSATISSSEQITTFLNEGCADLARNAVLVPGTSTLVDQSSAAYAYSALPTTDGGQIWYARSVAFNGAALKPLSLTARDIWFPTWQTDPTGVPVYWYRNGTQGIGLYPAPNSAGTLATAGFEIPPVLVNDTDTAAAWLPDHLTKLAVWYATAQVALQNDEDMSLKQRAMTWSQAYQEGVLELQKQVWQNDPSLAKALWGVPIPMPAMGAQPQQG